MILGRGVSEDKGSGRLDRFREDEASVAEVNKGCTKEMRSERLGQVL